jgi:hypothetical protein
MRLILLGLVLLGGCSDSRVSAESGEKLKPGPAGYCFAIAASSKCFTSRPHCMREQAIFMSIREPIIKQCEAVSEVWCAAPLVELWMKDLGIDCNSSELDCYKQLSYRGPGHQVECKRIP